MFSNREESVSINISYEDIVDEKTSAYIFKLIDQYKIAYRLTFEILESVSIDDFGSGYSNSKRILKLDIDYIKIYGSIIESITTDENSMVVAETIVYVAKKSNLKLVAEYICDEEVSEAVLKLGIDYRQGFYIGKPEEIDKYDS